MTEIKWIKLNIDMFDNRKIKQIRKLPAGNDMVLFWVMLLNLAGRCNSQGHILFTENIAYTPEMLATECEFELNTIKMALDIFSKFNMITVQNEVISIVGWSEHQNIDGMERAKLLANERVKRHRAKKKEILELTQGETCSSDSNVNVTLHETLRNGEVTHLDREIDKDIDIDIDISSKLDIKEALKKIEQTYFATFYRQMTSNYVQEILNILEKGDYTELIVSAIELTKVRSQQQNRNMNFKYSLSIIETWINKGYKTYDDVCKNEGGSKTGTDNIPRTAAYQPFQFDC